MSPSSPSSVVRFSSLLSSLVLPCFVAILFVAFSCVTLSPVPASAADVGAGVPAADPDAIGQALNNAANGMSPAADKKGGGFSAVRGDDSQKKKWADASARDDGGRGILSLLASAIASALERAFHYLIFVPLRFIIQSVLAPIANALVDAVAAALNAIGTFLHRWIVSPLSDFCAAVGQWAHTWIVQPIGSSFAAVGRAVASALNAMGSFALEWLLRPLWDFVVAPIGDLIVAVLAGVARVIMALVHHLIVVPCEVAFSALSDMCRWLDRTLFDPLFTWIGSRVLAPIGALLYDVVAAVLSALHAIFVTVIVHPLRLLFHRLIIPVYSFAADLFSAASDTFQFWVYVNVVLDSHDRDALLLATMPKQYGGNNKEDTIVIIPGGPQPAPIAAVLSPVEHRTRTKDGQHTLYSLRSSRWSLPDSGQLWIDTNNFALLLDTGHRASLTQHLSELGLMRTLSEYNQRFAIRFETVFVPTSRDAAEKKTNTSSSSASADLLGDEKRYFVTETLMTSSGSSNDNKDNNNNNNLFLTVNAQGTTARLGVWNRLQKHFGTNPQATDDHGPFAQRWFEAARSHVQSVGGAQKETNESIRSALRQGRAVAQKFGPGNILGERFNAQMLIQIPLAARAKNSFFQGQLRQVDTFCAALLWSCVVCMLFIKLRHSLFALMQHLRSAGADCRKRLGRSSVCCMLLAVLAIWFWLQVNTVYDHHSGAAMLRGRERDPQAKSHTTQNQAEVYTANRVAQRRATFSSSASVSATALSSGDVVQTPTFSYDASAPPTAHHVALLLLSALHPMLIAANAASFLFVAVVSSATLLPSFLGGLPSSSTAAAPPRSVLDFSLFRPAQPDALKNSTSAINAVPAEAARISATLPVSATEHASPILRDVQSFSGGGDWEQALDRAGIITVSLYYTVAGGVPSKGDIMRAVKELKGLEEAVVQQQTFRSPTMISSRPMLAALCRDVLRRKAIGEPAAAQAPPHFARSTNNDEAINKHEKHQKRMMLTRQENWYCPHRGTSARARLERDAFKPDLLVFHEERAKLVMSHGPLMSVIAVFLLLVYVRMCLAAERATQRAEKKPSYTV